MSPGTGLGPLIGLVAPIGGQAAEKSTPANPVPVVVGAAGVGIKRTRRAQLIYSMKYLSLQFDYNGYKSAISHST